MNFVEKVITCDVSEFTNTNLVIKGYGSTSSVYCNPFLTDIFCNKLVEFLSGFGVVSTYDSANKHVYINGVPFSFYLYTKYTYAGTSAGTSATPNLSIAKVLVISPYGRIISTAYTVTMDSGTTYAKNDCGSVLIDETTKTMTIKLRFCGTKKAFYFAVGSAAVVHRTTTTGNTNYYYIAPTTTEAFLSSIYSGFFYICAGIDFMKNKPAMFYGCIMGSITAANSYFYVVEQDEENNIIEPVSGKLEIVVSSYKTLYNRDSNKVLVKIILSDYFVLDTYGIPSMNYFFPSGSGTGNSITIFTVGDRTYWVSGLSMGIVDITEE